MRCSTCIDKPVWQQCTRNKCPCTKTSSSGGSFSSPAFDLSVLTRSYEQCITAMSCDVTCCDDVINICLHYLPILYSIIIHTGVERRFHLTGQFDLIRVRSVIEVLFDVVVTLVTMKIGLVRFVTSFYALCFAWLSNKQIPKIEPQAVMSQFGIF